jgi:hypothetical protein
VLQELIEIKKGCEIKRFGLVAGSLEIRLVKVLVE